MSDVMIEAQGLTKRYGHHRALDNATFSVRKGEVLGFLGPNGAGKSTTMRILTCFIAPSAGSARVNGCDIWGDPIGVRSAIGYLPESTPLYREMLTLEYLQFVASMRNLQGDAARLAIVRVVEQAGLGDVVAQEIGTLSKGFRQRVGLAQALIHEPPILILDEPMSGLDPNQAVEIRDLITAIGKERTVILSTHNLSEVQVTCKRVLIISNGRIVADDSPEALSSRGHQRYRVAALRNGKGVADVRKVFSDVAGVDLVRELTDATTDGELHFEVVPSSDQDLRPALFRAAVDGGVTLVELQRRAQNLEQIFRSLTIGGASVAGSSVPAPSDDSGGSDDLERAAPRASGPPEADDSGEAKQEVA